MKYNKISLLLICFVLLFVLCASAQANSRPTWGPLTTPIPEEQPVPPSGSRSVLVSGILQPCGVQYTLFKDGELLLEQGELSGRLTDDPVLKNYLSSITQLSFGENLHSVGVNSCMGLSELKVLKLGSSVETIGDWAFGDLKTLTSVSFSSNIKSIGEFAFAGCTSLRTITFPENITIDLAACSFQGCSNLVTIQFPQSGTVHIGDRVFAYCTALMEVEIPNSVNSMGVSIFEECSALRTVTFGCNHIDDRSFEGCGSITSFVFNPGVVSIGSRAFERCEGITTIVLPDCLVDIGTYAFNECRNLEMIVLPKSLVHVGYGFLKDCDNCTKGVYYRGTREEWRKIKTEDSKGKETTLCIKNGDSTYYYKFKYDNLEFSVTTDYNNTI